MLHGIERYLGPFGIWSGRAPDGSWMFVSDRSTQEVYSLRIDPIISMNSISAAESKKSNIRHRRTVGALVLALTVACLALAAGTPLVWSQQEPNNPGDRKLITRVEPQYPSTLERLYIVESCVLSWSSPQAGPYKARS